MDQEQHQEQTQMILHTTSRQNVSDRKDTRKLRGLSAYIPRDNSLLESANLIDDETRSPRKVYASTYQKNNPENEAMTEMNIPDTSPIIATLPKELVLLHQNWDFGRYTSI